MADKRPGGLTALAVFNFIFGGLGVLGALALLALVGAADAVISSAEGMEGATVDYDGPSIGVIYLSLVLGLVSAALLITSGVGYIKQKLFLGRKLGNAYACLSLLNTVIGLALIGGGFGIGTIIGLIYPILTLALLNTTFKEDLVN
jgi:hypothetical protein